MKRGVLRGNERNFVVEVLRIPVHGDGIDVVAAPVFASDARCSYFRPAVLAQAEDHDAGHHHVCLKEPNILDAEGSKIWSGTSLWWCKYS